MSRDVEAVVAERLHHLDLVLRHRPEGIIRAVRLLGRCRAVPVAAQIGGNDMEPLGQSRCDRVTHGVSGLPCRSNKGGPLPPWRRRICAPLVSMSVSAKPGMVSMSCPMQVLPR